MVAIAGAIIKQRTRAFDPSTFRDRYQEALRELIEAKMKGLPIKPRAVSAPAPVIDLMAALKRSLAQEGPALKRSTPAAKKEGRTRSAPTSLVIARLRKGDTQGRERSPIRTS
jgi:DNA end-binding protein Ku